MACIPRGCKFNRKNVEAFSLFNINQLKKALSRLNMRLKAKVFLCQYF